VQQPSTAGPVGMHEPEGAMPRALRPFSSAGASGAVPSNPPRIFVKALLTAPSEYLLCRVDGFVVTYELIDENEAFAMLPDGPGVPEPDPLNPESMIYESRRVSSERPAALRDSIRESALAFQGHLQEDKSSFRAALWADKASITFSDSMKSTPAQRPMRLPSFLSAERRSKTFQHILPTDNVEVDYLSMGKLAKEIVLKIFGDRVSDRREDVTHLPVQEVMEALDALPEALQLLVRGKDSLVSFFASIGEEGVTRKALFEYLTGHMTKRRDSDAARSWVAHETLSLVIPGEQNPENVVDSRMDVKPATTERNLPLLRDAPVRDAPSAEAMGRLRNSYGDQPERKWSQSSPRLRSASAPSHISGGSKGIEANGIEAMMRCFDLRPSRHNSMS